MIKLINDNYWLIAIIVWIILAIQYELGLLFILCWSAVVLIHRVDVLIKKPLQIHVNEVVFEKVQKHTPTEIHKKEYKTKKSKDDD